MKRIYLFIIVAWNYRKKTGFPDCKKENFAGLQAHRKRGKSARASPTPHHTLNEERSARFTAQPLSALWRTAEHYDTQAFLSASFNQKPVHVHTEIIASWLSSHFNVSFLNFIASKVYFHDGGRKKSSSITSCKTSRIVTFDEGLDGVKWQPTNGQNFNWQLTNRLKFNWQLTFALGFTDNWRRTWLSLIF